jgi:cytochrome c553
MPLFPTSLLRALCLVVLLGAAVQVQAAGDAERGKRLAYTCLGCHGVENYKNVYPTYSVPRLVGQHPDYIVAALKAYRSKERSHGTMVAQASSLSDEDMADIAAYLAGATLQSKGSAVGNAPAKVTELCVACHGKDGVGITGAYPTLSGQHADYLQRALHDYKNGGRKNAVMAPFVSTLSDADLALIADYYAQQQPALQTKARRIFWFSKAAD